MTDDRTAGRAGIPPWTFLLIAIAALILATAALTATLIGGWNGGRTTLMSSGGMMAGGMMPGGFANGAGGAGTANAPGPGGPGFVAGTSAAPRVIQVTAGPGYAFRPSTISVARGETVTFLVTSMGPLVHEFMVGPADAVAADATGTPEVADITMMTSKSLTFAFDGPGPYAFACHADGHYEAGMRGSILLVG
ncbi:MAG TPA: plastocyanin/azurin family copper-binding protein [Candidatus Limnocylindrales bacterium]|nr:plastocyanin/azurin family copper-binding protein [Candidatus Limnocylindrales bacterium]